MKNLKKISWIFAAVACVFMLSACSEEDAEALFGPENTWCCMDVEYKNSDETTAATVKVWCYYTDTAVTGTGTNNGMKSGITLPAGITFVVTTELASGSPITGLTSSTYILKSFPKDTDTTGLDETDTTYSFKGSKAVWASLYWLKSDLRKTDNQLEKNAILPLLASSGGGTELTWDSVKSTFSWKKLLANYLLQ